jgi:hypothetical protein
VADLKRQKMKRLIPLLAIVVTLLSVAGCASTKAEREKIRISAVLVDPESLILIGFTKVGYSEQQVLVQVTAPDELKDEVLALRFSVAWGQKKTSYGDLSGWQKSVGSAVHFTVRRKDITNEWPTENRRIYADKLRDVEWPNQRATAQRASRVAGC